MVSGSHPNNPLIVKAKPSKKEREGITFKDMEQHVKQMEQTMADLKAKQVQWEKLFKGRQEDFDTKRESKKGDLERRLKEFDTLVSKLKERDGILSNAATEFIGKYTHEIDTDVSSMNELIGAYNSVRLARQAARQQIHSYRTVFFKVFQNEFMNRDRYQQLIDLAKEIQQLAAGMAPTVRESHPLMLTRNKHWETMAAAEVIPGIGLYDYDKCYSEITRGKKALDHYENTVLAEDAKNTKAVADMVDKLRLFKVKQFDNVHLRMRKKKLNASISKAKADQKKIDLKLVMMDFELHDLKSDSREMIDLKSDKLRALADKQQAEKELWSASEDFLKADEKLRKKRIRLQKLQVESAGLKLMLPTEVSGDYTQTSQRDIDFTK